MNDARLLFDSYSQTHQHPRNVAIHWVCVPLILFAVIGLLRAIPIGNGIINFATFGIAVATVYYFSLSTRIGFGMLLVMTFFYLGAQSIYTVSSYFSYLFTMSFIFIGAWIGQFIGHNIEGKKPSFMEDLQFLLIGPAWILQKAFRISEKPL